MPLRLALFQPDIPQNAGTLLRFAACMDIAVDVIEPCGFVWSEHKMRRAGMDYLGHVELVRHRSWDFFQKSLNDQGRRLVLLTTKGAKSYTDYSFSPEDTVMVGRESAGVPEEVHDRADARLLIPMAPAMRSINVAVSAAMVLGEALRQTDGFPAAGR